VFVAQRLVDNHRASFVLTLQQVDMPVATDEQYTLDESRVTHAMLNERSESAGNGLKSTRSLFDQIQPTDSPFITDQEYVAAAELLETLSHRPDLSKKNRGVRLMKADSAYGSIASLGEDVKTRACKLVHSTMKCKLFCIKIYSRYGCY
jgi:hypothetical protein